MRIIGIRIIGISLYPKKKTKIDQVPLVLKLDSFLTDLRLFLQLTWFQQMMYVPSMSTTDENVEKVDHRITIREDADDVGISFGFCQET